MASSSRFTIAHVTHEAVEKLGGIGTVLEGLVTSPVYQKNVGRSILVGPTATHISAHPQERLGEHGEVLYSSIDQIDKLNLSGKFRPIEWAFGVAIVYGKRRFNPPGQRRSGEAEILLIDVFRSNLDRLNVFKLRLWETFGIDSSSYDQSWDYEEYTRLAEPAFYALQSLLSDEDLPCVIFSHEFMGMPTALQAILDGGDQFRTVFHAHECATARHLVENHPGHDTMFYNVLDQARELDLYVSDVFGPLDQVFRHALVRRAYLCDGVIAVGDRTRDELQFLHPSFRERRIDVIYNGLPAMVVTLLDKQKSQAMLRQYAKKLVGYAPDVLITHVTRPVISKGLWRDVTICHELSHRLAEEGRTAVLFILTSGGGVRRPQDVLNMERQYGWPRHHRCGFPDLVGPEVDIHRMIEPFNRDHRNLQIVLVNQFGWSRQRIGSRLPVGMTIADLRNAADVEFGMATYEPFGISPLEPLAGGAICVVSSVCGCEGFIRQVNNGQSVPNVLVANFTRFNEPRTIERLKTMTTTERDRLEHAEAPRVADELMRRLPRTDDQCRALIEAGQALVQKMGWDQLIERSLLPLLERIAAAPTAPIEAT